MDMGVCNVEIEQQTFDLTATMEMKYFEINPEGAPNIIHEDQDFEVDVKVVLYGRIRRHLCGELCVEIAFHGCSGGPDWVGQKQLPLDPCGDGTYLFKIRVPGGSLSGRECGQIYELCVTLGSRDSCGKSGVIFGTCTPDNITIVPKLTK
jgi:hypothetical protein